MKKALALLAVAVGVAVGLVAAKRCNDTVEPPTGPGGSWEPSPRESS